MSQIQKILERAERDGSIRPSAVSLVPDTPRAAPAAPVAAIPSVAAVATVPSTADVFFPMPTVEVRPATTAAVTTSATRVSHGHVSTRVLSALAPGSTSAEQYRALRTRIQQSANGRGIHALAITSAQRAEGRTHTAACLALTMAQEMGRRVVIVDANLRAPQLRRTFGLPDGPGLGDVLSERARLEDALVHLPDHNLTVLPGGDSATHSELLGSTAMRRVMQALRAQFDRIVIDAPAAIPVADVALLTPIVDGVMLVVRAGVTPRPVIHDAISGISTDKLLGVVLNDAR